MKRCKVDSLIKEMLLGHHTGLEENYYRPEEQDLLNEYLKCVDSLTINNEFRLRQEVQTLKVEKNSWEAQVDTLSGLSDMVWKLTAEVETLKNNNKNNDAN
jgi:hypothetical protein